MKNYDKNKILSYLKYQDVNNFYGLARLQKLPANDFKCVEETFQFNEDFIKSYNNNSDERCFLEVYVQ